MAPAQVVTVGDANAQRLGRRIRNNDLVDMWSTAHFAWGVALAILLGPWWAVAILIAWEPFEIFLLGPLETTDRKRKAWVSIEVNARGILPPT